MWCRSWLLLVFGCVLPLSIALAQQGSPTEVVGCLVRDPSGVLQLETVPLSSGKLLSVVGDTALLQNNVDYLIGATAIGRQGDAIVLSRIRVLARSCNSALPSKQVLGVEGKVGGVQKAVPITTTATTSETTPGFQTETPQVDSTSVAEVAGAIPPCLPELAGESQAAADRNAQAAVRAEMYPGTTLGVDIKTAPPSSVEASRRAGSVGTIGR